MPKVLIIYDSRTGNTEKAAMKVADGAREVEGIQCTIRKVDEAQLEDMIEADGIIIGSPTYYGCMSDKTKALLDRSVEIHGELEGRVGAAFTSSGGTATGAETTILSILKAFLIHGMIVKGDHEGQHYGLAVVGDPDMEEEKLCKRFGTRVAELVTRISGKTES